MSRFQVEFQQVLHRFAPYHPVTILVLLFGLSVLSVSLYSLQVRNGRAPGNPGIEAESFAEACQAFDQLEAYVEHMHPMTNVAEVFKREAPPPPPPPVIEVVEVPEEVEPEVVLAPLPVLRLSAVFKSNGQALAEIEGKLYGVGDTVTDGCTVQDIEPERVHLAMQDGRRLELELYDENKKAP